MISSAGTLAGLLEREVASGAMPGAVWWVGDASGVISTGAVGRAAIEPAPEPASVSTPYDLASLTKPLATAFLLCDLASEGRIDLDAPLARWVEELSGTPYAGVTARAAAVHQGRFPAWRPLYVAGHGEASYLRSIGSSEPIEAARTLYSDLGYIALGVALARSSGEALDVQFDARVARSLGLGRSGFARAPRIVVDAAPTERGNAYERKLAGDAGASYPFRSQIIRGEAHDANAWALGGVAGHAGLFGTADEAARIAIEILARARGDAPGGPFASMIRAHAAEPGARTIGFLRAADSDSVRGVLPDDAVGHFGFTGTSVWIDPARPRIYVLLTNRVHPVVPAAAFTATRRAFHIAAAGL